MNAPFPIPAVGLRYLSVCSGIEAASVAREPLGWTPVAFAEIEAFLGRILAHHWPQVPNLGDMTTIDLGTLGRVDLLVGGTPCQAFSVAGRRRSLADARGNLSLAYVDLAHALVDANGLRWAIWENVPGVLSLNDNAFGCLLGTFVGGDGAVLPAPKPPRGRSTKLWRWRAAGRWPVLDDDGLETGAFVERAEGHVCRWPDAGLVAGPFGRAAWRILDAQYFGLAQRRRRVFVVVGFGDGADPAAVLFEPQGLRRHPPSRGEAGQDLARPLAAGSQSSGGYRNDADTADNLIAFGGNNTAGPIDVATALNAHGGPNGRQDFESETFVVAPALTGNPYGDHESREGLLVTHSLRGEGFDASEDGTGRGTPIVPICFDPRQADVIVHGDRTGPLDTQYPGPAIAFSCKDHGQDATVDLAPTLRAMPGVHANAGGQSAVAAAWGVRRLTPKECHRLQGFPDDHCALLGAADGPIYKALGNSMAVPVMAWIGARIAAVEAAREMRAAAE